MWSGARQVCVIKYVKCCILVCGEKMKKEKMKESGTRDSPQMQQAIADWAGAVRSAGWHTQHHDAGTYSVVVWWLDDGRTTAAALALVLASTIGQERSARLSCWRWGRSRSGCPATRSK
jgi:cell division inhibitor SulA